MADPLTLTFAIFSIVSSTTAFSATLHDTLRKIREHEPELRKQIDDISVLVAVLQECGALFMSDIRIPEAAEGAMDACVSRHHDLVAVMHQIEVYRSRRPSQFSKFLQSARIIARERERKAAFDAFRDSVLLLRDLASEYLVSVHEYLCLVLILLQSEIEPAACGYEVGKVKCYIIYRELENTT
jgi:hypothetical protein